MSKITQVIFDHELNELNELFYAERHDNDASEMRRITQISRNS